MSHPRQGKTPTMGQATDGRHIDATGEHTGPTNRAMVETLASGLHRTSVVHPITGQRLHLSSRNAGELARRRAYLEDLRRELGAAVHCPHCGGDLGVSRVTPAEVSELFQSATTRNVGHAQARAVRLIPALERWIETLDPVYADKPRAVLRNQIAPHFGASTPFLSLTRPRLEAWTEALRAEGYAPKTVRLAFDLVAGAYRRLVRSHTLPERPPWEGFKPPRVPKATHPHRRALSAEELGRLVAGIAPRNPERARLVLFAALTGLRSGELVALSWDDVDAARGLLTIRHNAPDDWRTKFPDKKRPTWPTKGRKVGAQALHPQALAAILEQRAELERRGRWRSDGPVWPDKDGDYRGNNNALRPETIQRDAAAAGVGPVSAHVLRHTFATLEAASGASLLDVSTRMRHASVRQTEDYLHRDEHAPSRVPSIPIPQPLDRTEAK